MKNYPYLTTSIQLTNRGFQRAWQLLLLALIMQAGTASAQLNPFASMYFQNQYLSNPAMAGMGRGLNLNVALRQQWTTLPGSPQMQAVTADYYASSRMGLGINLTNDEAGLTRQTRTLVTYAYHVQLGGNNQRLSFGLSAGITDQHINYSEVDADQGDNQVMRYNNQNPYLDGDFGAAYTSDHLSVQAVLPNLGHLIRQNTLTAGVDRSIFFTAVSYKIALTDFLGGSTLEPKIVFRGIHGYTDILDAGANLVIRDELLDFFALYHSTQSESFGFGARLIKDLHLIFFYTTETSALRTYANGDFEVALKYRISK